MQSSNMRERSRSPIETKVDYDEEQDDMGRYDKSSFDSKSRDRERSSSEDRRGRKENRQFTSSCKVYIANLPFSFKWQEVKDLIKKKVGMVDFVETFDHENSNPRGCAVVEFRTKELAQLGLESIPDIVVNGRQLRVYSKEEASNCREFRFLFRQSNENRRSVLDRIQSRNSSSVFPRVEYNSSNFSRRESSFNQSKRETFNEYWDTYGLSVDFLKSLNILGPLTNRIFVANIDFKAKDEDLEKVFQLAGQVKSVDISKDSEGKSRGFAVVEFEHPVHAVQAVSMFHNQKYFDRELCVRMDRDVGPKKRDQQPSNLPPGLSGIGAGLGMNGSALTDMNTFGTLSRTDVAGSSPRQGNSNLPMGTNSNVNPNFNQMGMMGMDNMNSMTNMATAGGLPMNNSFGGNPNMQSGIGSGFPSNFGNQMSMNSGMAGQNMNPDYMGRSDNMQGNHMNSFDMGMNRPSMDGYGDSVRRNGEGNIMNRRPDTVNEVRSNISGGDVGISGRSATRFEGRTGSGGGQTMGSATSRIDGRSGGINLPNVVHISNLPDDYTWQNLRDLCHDYGEVRFAEITRKGVGLVRFARETSASMAVDLLDRQRFDGKLLEAKIM